MTCDEYSRPERATEIGLARRQLAKVAADPCHFCLHRENAFGKSICPTLGRIWPRCMSTPGLQFDPDYERLKGDQP